MPWTGSGAGGEPSFVQPSLLDAAGQLAARLVAIAPEGLRRVTFANSGAEAVEAAIKLCRAATGRPGILSTYGSFHGKTLGALSATGNPDYQRDRKVRWVLQEKVDQGIRFRADYVVAFEGDGTGHIRWRSVEGNMRNDGDVWIRPRPGGGSEIRYCESVEPDLPITPLMARLIKPLVARELRGEIRGFLERVRTQLSV